MSFTCAICFDDIESGDRNFLPCTHCFHDNCIKQWIKQRRNCPSCKIPIDQRENGDAPPNDFAAFVRTLAESYRTFDHHVAVSFPLHAGSEPFAIPVFSMPEDPGEMSPAEMDGPSAIVSLFPPGAAGDIHLHPGPQSADIDFPGTGPRSADIDFPGAGPRSADIDSFQPSYPPPPRAAGPGLAGRGRMRCTCDCPIHPKKKQTKKKGWYPPLRRSYSDKMRQRAT